MGKTFWTTWLTFSVAMILFILSPFFMVLQMDLIWYGILLVFGFYSGTSGFAAIVKTGTMPINQQYTIPYSKMLILVILTWVLFLTTVIMQMIFKEMIYEVSKGFLIASGITGIFASTKKINIAIDIKKEK